MKLQSGSHPARTEFLHRLRPEDVVQKPGPRSFRETSQSKSQNDHTERGIGTSQVHILRQNRNADPKQNGVQYVLHRRKSFWPERRYESG